MRMHKKGRFSFLFPIMQHTVYLQVNQKKQNTPGNIYIYIYIYLFMYIDIDICIDMYVYVFSELKVKVIRNLLIIFNL